MRPMTPEERLKVTLMGAVDTIRTAAAEKTVKFMELGVFLLYSTAAGDAWLLEVTDSDCVQLAVGGDLPAVPINEDPETIEIDWTHTFAIVAKKFEITAYTDRSVSVLDDCPVQEVHAARKRILKKFSPEQLQQVHIR